MPTITHLSKVTNVAVNVVAATIFQSIVVMIALVPTILPNKHSAAVYKHLSKVSNQNYLV